MKRPLPPWLKVSLDVASVLLVFAIGVGLLIALVRAVS